MFKNEKNLEFVKNYELSYKLQSLMNCFQLDKLQTFETRNRIAF